MSLDIRWLSLFADVPAGRFPAARSFWERVTGTVAGRPTGEQGEFVPLLPSDGDRFLWLQRVDDPTGGWHPDLHVADLDAAARTATGCGARLRRRTDSLAVFETPAGQPFCLFHDELFHDEVFRDGRAPLRRRPAPVSWPRAPAGGRPADVADAARSLADQLCLDIPADRAGEEVAFWRRLTGWRYTDVPAPEFSRLSPPQPIPVQFLMQRLGPDDAGSARAHLDMSADDPDGEVRRHEALGARVVGRFPGWTTLRDPAGLTYCVTRRRPGEPPR